MPAEYVEVQVSAGGQIGFIGNAAQNGDDEEDTAMAIAPVIGQADSCSKVSGLQPRGKSANALIQIRLHDRARVDAIVDVLASSGAEDDLGSDPRKRYGGAGLAEARVRAIAAARAQAEAAGMRIARVLGISERVAPNGQNFIDQFDEGGAGWTLYAAQMGGASIVAEPRARALVSVDYVQVVR